MKRQAEKVISIGSDLFGLVLVGGESSRFGREKRSVNFHDLPQEEYLRKLLQNFCIHVFISCNSAQKINPNYDSIVDTYDFKGPLNGIMSAFKAHPDKSWLVVAVDLPFVNQDILTTLLSHRDSNYLATCFFNSDYNFPEPLLSIWEPSSFAMLRTYCEGGGRSPREFLTKHRTKLIDLTDRLILRGFNTKEELEELKGKEKTKAKS